MIMKMDESEKLKFAETIKTLHKFCNEKTGIFLDRDSVYIKTAQKHTHDLVIRGVDPMQEWIEPEVLRKEGMCGIDYTIYTFVMNNKHLFIDPTSQFGLEKVGSFEIEWKSGGTSNGTTYIDREGTRMIVCSNWVSPAKLTRILQDSDIKKYKRI